MVQRSRTLTALLAAIAGLMLCANAGAQDAGQAHQGAEFLSTDPIALSGPGASSLEVKVFNGNPERHSIRLEPDAEVAPFIKTERKEGEDKVRPPGGVATFVVRMEKTPAKKVTGELLAFSSDGTMARAPISLAAKGPDAEKEAANAAKETAAGYPSTLDYGAVDTGESPSITVANLPGTATTEVQVGHVSSNGNAIAVMRKDDTLTIGKLNEHGAYAGTVDLTPDKDGGTVELSVDARESASKAAVLLLLGLLLAALAEVFVRRLRPEFALQRRLRGLKKLVELRQRDAARQIAALQPDGVTWGIPRVYVTDNPSSLLAGKDVEITQNLKNAGSDAQRDRWGPDGAEMKALETDMETYDALLARLARAARDWSRWTPRIQENTTASPLRRELDQQLSDRVIEADGLEMEKKASEALATSLDAMIGFHGRFQQLEALAVNAGNEAAAKEATRRRKELVETYFGAADDERFTKAFEILSAKIHGDAEQEAPVSPPATPPRPSVAAPSELMQSRYAVLGMPAATSAGDDLAPPPAPLERQHGLTGRLMRNISLVDLGFFVFSILVALGSGLTLLYFDDDTFGYRGDEIELLVWGATASAGIALARRLLPGAVKSLTGE